VIVEDDDIYGDGVNIAARIEALADAGGVFVSNTVHDQVRDRLPFLFEDLGERQVKNIARPVRIYRVRDLGADRANPLAPVLPLPDKPSVAVLPFINMSGDPDQEFFADGIAEDIITALSRYPSLFVIARNSCFIYKGRAADVKQIGRELGVRYVIEGSLRKSGNRIRVTAQLGPGRSRQARLGRALRPRCRRHLRIAGRDHPPFNRAVVGPSAGFGPTFPGVAANERHCLVFGHPWQQAPPATVTIGQRDPWVARLAALELSLGGWTRPLSESRSPPLRPGVAFKPKPICPTRYLDTRVAPAHNPRRSSPLPVLGR